MSNTTQEKAQVSWVMDERGIQKAWKRLRLKYPPLIEFRYDEWGCGGYDKNHIVWLNPNVVGEPKDADITLWHELAHAMQCERDYGGDPHLMIHETQPMRDFLFEECADLLDQDYNTWYDMYFELQPLEHEAEELAQWYACYIPLVMS